MSNGARYGSGHRNTRLPSQIRARRLDCRCALGRIDAVNTQEKREECDWFLTEIRPITAKNTAYHPSSELWFINEDRISWVPAFDLLQDPEKVLVTLRHHGFNDLNLDDLLATARRLARNQ